MFNRSGAVAAVITMVACLTSQASAQTTSPMPPSPSRQGTSPARSSELTTPDLVTDRPDFTESSEVVGRGQVQLESGLTIEADRSGTVSSRALSAPAALVRIGVSRHVELRLGGQGFLRGWTTTPGATAVSGHSDVEVGAKVKLLDRAAFDLAVIPIVSIPAQDVHYSSNGYDSTVKFTWAGSLPLAFDVSGNVNVASLSDALGRFSQHAVSVSLAHDLAGGWGGYWEAYTFTPMERGLGSGTTFNSGVTHKIGPDAQVDVEVGHGMTASAPDWFLGVGFAVRRSTTRR